MSSSPASLSHPWSSNRSVAVQLSSSWPLAVANELNQLSSTEFLSSNKSPTLGLFSWKCRILRNMSWVSKSDTEQTQSHLHHILLANGRYKASSDSQKGEIDSTNWWKELEYHFSTDRVEHGTHVCNQFIRVIVACDLPQNDLTLATLYFFPIPWAVLSLALAISDSLHF